MTGSVWQTPGKTRIKTKSSELLNSLRTTLCWESMLKGKQTKETVHTNNMPELNNREGYRKKSTE